MYLSGVMYTISDHINKLSPGLRHIVQANPASVYMELVRHAMIPSIYSKQHYPHNHLDLPPHVWALAVGWAIVAFVVGYVFFWKAEEEYGRG
jgi:teichoic acid transport system permease protein